MILPPLQMTIVQHGSGQLYYQYLSITAYPQMDVCIHFPIVVYGTQLVEFHVELVGSTLSFVRSTKAGQDLKLEAFDITGLKAVWLKFQSLKRKLYCCQSQSLGQEA